MERTTCGLPLTSLIAAIGNYLAPCNHKYHRPMMLTTMFEVIVLAFSLFHSFTITDPTSQAGLGALTTQLHNYDNQATTSPHDLAALYHSAVYDHF